MFITWIVQCKFVWRMIDCFASVSLLYTVYFQHFSAVQAAQ